MYLFFYHLFSYFYVSHHYMYMFLICRYNDVKKLMFKRAFRSLPSFISFLFLFLLSFISFLFLFFLSFIFFFPIFLSLKSLILENYCGDLFFPQPLLPIRDIDVVAFHRISSDDIFFEILSLKFGNFNQLFSYLAIIE